MSTRVLFPTPQLRPHLVVESHNTPRVLTRSLKKQVSDFRYTPPPSTATTRLKFRRRSKTAEQTVKSVAIQTNGPVTRAASRRQPAESFTGVKMKTSNFQQQPQVAIKKFAYSPSDDKSPRKNRLKNLCHRRYSDTYPLRPNSGYSVAAAVAECLNDDAADIGAATSRGVRRRSAADSGDHFGERKRQRRSRSPPTRRHSFGSLSLQRSYSRRGWNSLQSP